MPELSAAYHATRERVSELAAALGDHQLGLGVPACPDWTVHDLLAHMTGIPEALASGNYPAGDLQAWLDGLVVERRDVPVAELLERWAACAEPTSAMIDSGAGAMTLDVVVHEHDLRGAVGQPGARGSAEVRAVLQPALDSLASALSEAGLGALLVDTGAVQWASHFAKPGCTLHVDPWDALRAVESRRTADELRALPHTGDIEPYVAVIAAHRQLPATSLGET